MTTFVTTFFIVLGAYLLVLMGFGIYKRFFKDRKKKHKDQEDSNNVTEDKHDD